MDYKKQLMTDLKVAMRAKDKETRDTIRLMQAAIKQVEIDGRKTLDNDAVQAVLMKQAKQRRESIAEYEKNGRAELAAVEKVELAIIDRYLPKMMSREELEPLVRQAIADTGAAGPRGMGQVMGRLMPQVRGKADGKLVNQVVRELLNS